MKAKEAVEQINREETVNERLVVTVQILHQESMNKIRVRGIKTNSGFLGLKKEMINWLGAVKKIGNYDWLMPEKVFDLMMDVVNAPREA